MKKSILLLSLSAAAVLAVSTYSFSYNGDKTESNANPITLETVTVPEFKANSANIIDTSEYSFENKKTEPNIVSLKKLDIIDKDSCYHKMLNSVDYYNYANGRIETNLLNGEECTIVYNVDMIDNVDYQRVTTPSFDEEISVHDNSIEVINKLTDEKSLKPLQFTKTMETGNYDNDKARITTTDGIPTYCYRMNPTNLHYASTVSIFPQEMVFGFLANKENWSITGKSEYIGRDIITLEGKTEPDYGAKLNISTFKMYIDSETGILLHFEGYDSQNTLVSYVNTIEFSDEKK